MADGPQLPNLHALGLLDNKSGGGATSGDGLANEKESPEIIVEGANKVASTGAKLLQTIPLIGSFFAVLIPTNVGQVSLFGSVETQGLTGKTINPGKGGTTGGVLANIAMAFIKNSAITDQTGGTGGDASGGGGDGGAGGGGGGDGGHGFESYASSSGMGEMFIAAGGGNHFEYRDFSPSDLGTLSSPIIGDMGRGGRGAAMDIG